MTIAIARPRSDDDPSWRRWVPAEPGAWSEPAPGHFRARAASETGGPSSAITTSSRAPSSGRRSARGGPPDRARPSLITDFCSYNTGRARTRIAATPAGGPGLVPAALGRRPDALDAAQRPQACRPAPARPDQGRPRRTAARSTWPAARRVSSAAARPWLRPHTTDRHGRALRTLVRQRGRPTDPLGRRRAPVRRRRELSDGPAARPPTADDCEPVRIAAHGGRRRRRRPGAEARRVLHARSVARATTPNFDGPAWDDSSAFFELAVRSRNSSPG